MSKKKTAEYSQRTINMNYCPTKDKEYKLPKSVKVKVPPYVECTHTVGLKIIKELGYTAFSLYMALLSYRNTKTNECFPSIETLHKYFGFNEKTVKANLDKLSDAGYIDINSGNKGTASNYYFPKEYFYSAWEEDFFQSHAQRHKAPFKEKRKTKVEVQKEELEAEVRSKNREIEELKRKLEQATGEKTHPHFTSDPDEPDPF